MHLNVAESHICDQSRLNCPFTWNICFLNTSRHTGEQQWPPPRFNGLLLVCTFLVILFYSVCIQCVCVCALHAHVAGCQNILLLPCFQPLSQALERLPNLVKNQQQHYHFSFSECTERDWWRRQWKGKGGGWIFRNPQCGGSLWMNPSPIQCCDAQTRFRVSHCLTVGFCFTCWMGKKHCKKNAPYTLLLNLKVDKVKTPWLKIVGYFFLCW